MWAKLIPMAIELIVEYKKDGLSNANITEFLAAINKMDNDDLQMLGCDLQIIGACLQQIAVNHAPSEKNRNGE